MKAINAKRLFGVSIALVAGCVLVVLLWLINQFGLFHYFSPNGYYSDVMVSRFMLGRWPTTWQEVKTATRAYDGYDTGSRHFDSIELLPMLGDACVVKLHFRNIIGYPYVDQKKLTWSAEEEKRISADEIHTKLAHWIARDYCRWVREKNHGQVSADMGGIRRDIDDWSGSTAPIERVALGTDTPVDKDNADRLTGPVLIVTFKDGTERRVPLKEELAHPSEF